VIIRRLKSVFVRPQQRISSMKLLHVDSSILGANSITRTLSAEIVVAQRQLHPGLEVTYRDLGANPVDHLTGAHLAAGQGVAPEAASLREDVAAGQAALEEFLAADILVVGAPMYNFTVPSQLKAWIDRLAVAGRTFRYTEKGPEGLAGGKTVIVASGRGGFYGVDAPGGHLDHQESFLRAIFGFFGITNVSFIRAEGVAMGAEQRQKALDAARVDIAQIAKLAA
jgi:FMN-dependent NADH-azoreductase